MADVQTDIRHAQSRLQESGWVARRAEAFRHLPPPALEQWLQTEDTAQQVAPTGSGWSVKVAQDAPVEVQHLSALDAEQRALLFTDVPAPEDDDAAPFAWAHRALCREGLRIRVRPDHEQHPVQIEISHQPANLAEAPMLVIELEENARCVLIEAHEIANESRSDKGLAQNLQAHIHLQPKAHLRHLRVVTPAAHDRIAHHLHTRLEAGSHYAQALVAGGSSYHLQRNVIDLLGPDSVARNTGLLLTGEQALDHQTLTRMHTAQNNSHVEALALASGKSRTAANAYTRIAPACTDADVHQRLAGIALDGAPRMWLQPHLEIHHDQVQAEHGATWGALPEDALFYARQRGLDEVTARTLIIEGMARAALSRCLDTDASFAPSDALTEWLESDWLGRAIQMHLSAHMEKAHG